LDLIEVKIDFLLEKKQEAFFDIYLKLKSNSNKFTKYADKAYNNVDELLKLKSRGISAVYVNKDIFKSYVTQRVDDIEEKEKKKEEIKKVDLNDFKSNNRLLRDLFISTGFDDQSCQIVEEMTKSALNELKNHPKIKSLLKDFAQNQGKAFSRKKLVSFLACYIMSKHPNIDDQHLERVSTAILICDLTLDDDEFFYSYEKFDDIFKMDDKIRFHGQELLDSLPKSSFFESTTLINLIKNHHEKPDGSGYPYGIKHHKFDIFLAIYYLAEEFVDKFIVHNLKTNKIKAILSEINQENSKYTSINFQKALELLNYCFSKGDLL
jgi:HD-GYP domain-containing protein (c-di-GMP phosphodiesterase class II)